jgi:putative PIN family toxin of toxin-antitoxin system
VGELWGLGDAIAVQGRTNCGLLPLPLPFDKPHLMKENHLADDMKNLPKLLIDTNVLVAATRNRRGPSFALMQLVRLEKVTVCCSPALFLEYEEVLKRPDQLAASGLLASDIDAILSELAGKITPVKTHYQWKPQLRDPADEMVLEAAVNAQAQAIVTYNLRDFGPAKLFGIPVLNPEQTFKQLNLSAPRSTQP